MGSIISFAQKHTQLLACGSNRSIAGIDRARGEGGSRSEFFRRAAEKLLKQEQEAKAARNIHPGLSHYAGANRRSFLSIGDDLPKPCAVNPDTYCHITIKNYRPLLHFDKALVKRTVTV